jgi:hypothetical protein
MLRCVTGQAFALIYHCLPPHRLPCAVSRGMSLCRPTRLVSRNSRPCSRNSSRNILRRRSCVRLRISFEKEFTAHCTEMCQRLDNMIEQQSAMSQKLDDMLKDMSRISKMTKDMSEQLSAMSETSRLISGKRPRRSQLQLEVGERAGSHATFSTWPEWLQRLAMPLQAAGVSPAEAQANIIRNLLKVQHTARRGRDARQLMTVCSAVVIKAGQAIYDACVPTGDAASDRPDSRS